MRYESSHSGQLRSRHSVNRFPARPGRRLAADRRVRADQASQLLDVGWADDQRGLHARPRHFAAALAGAGQRRPAAFTRPYLASDHRCQSRERGSGRPGRAIELPRCRRAARPALSWPRAFQGHANRRVGGSGRASRVLGRRRYSSAHARRLGRVQRQRLRGESRDGGIVAGYHPGLRRRCTFRAPDGTAAEGSGTAFGPIASVLKSADFTAVDPETAVTSRGTPQPKTYHFRTTSAAFTALRDGGVDLVTMANNHVLDYGQVGLADTLAAAGRPGSHTLESAPTPRPHGLRTSRP